MWLITSAGTFLRWAYSVYRKILRIAPGSIALVVLATLVSQLSRLAAFFLPLKIVLLVGGSRVPSYFPGFLRTQPPETVVIELAALTVVFYVLHQLSEKVVAFRAERSADLLLGRADKLVMFANQEGVARNACQKLAESLAALIFVALSLVLIRLVHHNMALFLVGWVAAAVLFVATGGAWSARFRAWLDGNAKSFVTGVSQTSLFAATAFIVGEFVAGAKFNILYAIISLLLAREALQQLANAVNNALALNPLKPLVNAMFFQNHAWPGAGGAQRKDVWDWVAGDRLAQWLPGILRDVTGKPAQRPTMELWHQTGMTDLFVFDARVETGDGDRPGYLVKLFAPSRNVAAAQEAALLAGAPAGSLPAPNLAGTGKVDGFGCHVFGEIAWRTIAPEEFGEAQNAMRGACLACNLPAGLVTRFRRSHQLLDRKLLDARIDRLALVADDGERELVERFATALHPLAAFLGGLPLALHNPDLLAPPVFVLETGQAVASHWTRWSLEPIGGGWPVQAEDFRQIRKWLSKAKETRPDLADVTPPQAQLAALLFAFEKFLARQRYRSAIGMLPRIFTKAEEAGVLAAPEAQAEEIALAAAAS